MELIKRQFHFPNMKEKVSRYIAKCTSCRKNKHKIYKPYREPQFIPIKDVP
jgi:hypothetical protein